MKNMKKAELPEVWLILEDAEGSVRQRALPVERDRHPPGIDQQLVAVRVVTDDAGRDPTRNVLQCTRTDHVLADV